MGDPSRLKTVVLREKGKGENHPSSPWQDMQDFVAALEGRKGMAALALRFSILTGARTGAAR